jgi:Fic family protein
MAYFLISKPFQNHNVHLSRILTTLILLKTGYHYVPYSSFERIIEINHEYYSLALKRTQESVLSDEPDFETWITFFLKIMITQKRNLEKKLDIEKKANRHVSALDSQIINIISEFEKISIGGIQKKTGANRNTLKKHLARLTEENYIVRFGKARASWYSLSI